MLNWNQSAKINNCTNSSLDRNARTRVVRHPNAHTAANNAERRGTRRNDEFRLMLSSEDFF